MATAEEDSLVAVARTRVEAVVRTMAALAERTNASAAVHMMASAAARMMASAVDLVEAEAPGWLTAEEVAVRKIAQVFAEPCRAKDRDSTLVEVAFGVLPSCSGLGSQKRALRRPQKSGLYPQVLSPSPTLRHGCGTSLDMPTLRNQIQPDEVAAGNCSAGSCLARCGTLGALPAEQWRAVRSHQKQGAPQWRVQLQWPATKPHNSRH